MSEQGFAIKFRKVCTLCFVQLLKTDAILFCIKYLKFLSAVVSNSETVSMGYLYWICSRYRLQYKLHIEHIHLYESIVCKMTLQTFGNTRACVQRVVLYVPKSACAPRMHTYTIPNRESVCSVSQRFNIFRIL